MLHKKAHILVENKSNSVPKWVIFFDTETYEDKINDKLKALRLRLGYAMLCRKNRNDVLYKVSDLVFKRREEFYIWLGKIIRNNETYHIVAHNMEFDFRIVNASKFMPLYGWKLKKFINEGLNFIVRYSRQNSHIIWLNNMQYFNVKLETLGKSVGLDKLKVDFDIVSEEELLTYCKRDVEIMLQAWNKLYRFIKDNDLGNFAYSIAGQSFNAFRHRFNDKLIYIHNNPKAIQLERESYHGGRVEAFYIGKYDKSKVYYLDVNSMYPFVMKKNTYPIKLVKYIDKPSISDLIKYQNKYNIIADVNVTIKNNYLPSIKDDRLIWGTGTFNTVLAEPELKVAFINGNINYINRLAIYEGDYIFKDYVEFFYKKRLEYKHNEDEAFTYLSKLMLNSLYGKFGQKNTIWDPYGEMPNGEDGIFENYDAARKEWFKIRIMSGKVEKAIGTEEGFNSFVAVCSFVTSYARVYLNNLIITAGSDNVLYCDTDSLFVTEKGYRKLKDKINPDILGYLKLVETADSITINGAKDYVFNNKEVIKGVRKDAVKKGKGLYEQDQFEGFKGAMRNSRTDTVVIKRQDKQLNREYNKGIVTPSGWVEPFVLP